MRSKAIYCCICSNHTNKWIDGEKVTMHRFTLNQNLQKIWLSRCKLIRSDFRFTSYNSTRICGHHFVGNKGPTKIANLPSIFPTRIFKITHYSPDVSTAELEIPENADMHVHKTTEEDLIEGAVSSSGNGSDEDTCHRRNSESNDVFHPALEVYKAISKSLPADSEDGNNRLETRRFSWKA
ncbi:uncharacterized protein LOC121370080 [Gigantopelta aegis]|uniref:uncharacterized protein LOC121370080 n=1 Tax=Gigantopelta aegis TaxID=1735272 RepID=UPI001B88B419|nr:uncharacterized protein LOC121370080 [Gigantopelta aegis]